MNGMMRIVGLVCMAAVCIGTLPSRSAGTGVAGGDGEEVSECSTTRTSQRDCSGTSCSSTYWKCIGCQSSIDQDKEYKCVAHQVDGCDITGCKKRGQHQLDDDCIVQECN